MSLKEKINRDLIKAMKAKEELTLSTLRMIKSAIMKYETGGANMVANDDILFGLLKREVKMRQEASDGFEKGGNKAAAEKERAEIKIIQKYLPEAMSEDQVRVIVQQVIDTLKPTGPQDFGKVMGAAMKETKGKADGNLVSRMVKELVK
ncbi:GatB/YqeY domain-containing protein [Candidatus Peregrinibacteria bacterium]|nr:GatB/YqeY domain-containing protein [Candidatus Peregrinibacteria bacterium]